MRNSRGKFYCQPCDYVTKSKGGAYCPTCGVSMTPMGTQWRPGRAGTKTRLWDTRQSPEHSIFWWGNYSWPRPSRTAGRKRRRYETEKQRPVPQHGHHYSFPSDEEIAARR